MKSSLWALLTVLFGTLEAIVAGHSIETRFAEPSKILGSVTMLGLFALFCLHYWSKQEKKEDERKE